MAPFAHYLADGIPALAQVQAVAWGYDTICTFQYPGHRLSHIAVGSAPSRFLLFPNSMRTELLVVSFHTANIYSTNHGAPAILIGSVNHVLALRIQNPRSPRRR